MTQEITVEKKGKRILLRTPAGEIAFRDSGFTTNIEDDDIIKIGLNIFDRICEDKEPFYEALLKLVENNEISTLWPNHLTTK